MQNPVLQHLWPNSTSPGPIKLPTSPSVSLSPKVHQKGSLAHKSLSPRCINNDTVLDEITVQHKRRQMEQGKNDWCFVTSHYKAYKTEREISLRKNKKIEAYETHRLILHDIASARAKILRPVDTSRYATKPSSIFTDPYFVQLISQHFVVGEISSILWFHFFPTIQRIKMPKWNVKINL